jgi:hypothetical protein
MSKVRRKSKDERRTAVILVRTTTRLKALAERAARAEGRSLANLLERLIWDGCRGDLSRSAPYQAAGGDLRRIGADSAA